MASQFFGLNIAYSGLTAASVSQNTTANNIANVDTKGYSRQQTVQEAANALRVFQQYGCAGAGVETLAVERIRNEFYDVRYWNNNTRLGEYDAKQYYMQQIEIYFEDNGISGFNSVFNSFMGTTLEELLKDPSSSTARAQFIAAASDLTEYFNGLYTNLQELQKDANAEIKVKVEEINSLASEIATLNKQINTIEMAGGIANELRDRRTLLVDKLSEIVNVEVVETPASDPNNPNMDTGATRYILKVAGGHLLVDGNEYNTLECIGRTTDEKVNQSDVDGLYDVYWSNGEKFSLSSGSLGGYLQGLAELRDGNNGEYFNGKILSTGKTANGAQDTVTIEAGKSYLQDLNKSNLSESGVINLGNKLYYYDSWEYNISYDDNGQPVYTYTFTLSDSELNDQRLTNNCVGKTGSVGSSVNYQGIPYYMSQMNEWVRTFSQKVNDIFTSGYDSYDDPGNILLTGNLATDRDQYKLEKDKRYDLYEEKVKEIMVAQGITEADAKKLLSISVSSTDDSYYRLTAGNFSVLSDMLLDAGLLATSYNKSNEGVEQTDLLKDLKSLATDKNKMSFRGSSAREFLQCVMGDVALNTRRAESFYDLYSNIAGSIDNYRLSISGVDQDEEAANLVKFQNSFNLASKMIQVFTEVYDRLILQTGV